MASLDPWTKSPPFFMPSGRFTKDQKYGFNINDHQFFFSLKCQVSSVTQSYLTLSDPMNHHLPGLPVHHQIPEFTQTHVH